MNCNVSEMCLYPEETIQVPSNKWTDIQIVGTNKWKSI